METLSYLGAGLIAALQPTHLAYCFLGVLIGTLVGVLPGIGPPGALALLLPITFHAPPVASLIMLFGICYGAQYGGSTTSILVNIPGEASSMITCIDGYAMARKGRAGPALGIAAFGSFIAGTGSIFGMIFVAPPLAEIALRFGPPEFFGLMTFGMTVLIYLARKSMAKALIMALFGLILATVGLDPLSGYPRFTYNIMALRDGLGLAQMMIGLFGLSEVLISLEKSAGKEILQTKIKGLLPNLQDWKDSFFPIIRGSIIGFFLGIIPGISVTIPTFVSYAVEKKLSKHPERFGTGIIEGVAAPESANNAANNGTMVPLLSLGIPTGAASAIILGALMIYGLNPGPLFIKQSPQIFWAVIGSMYVGNVMCLVLNLPLIGLWVKVLKIPHNILFLLIILFCLVGSYTINFNLTDMYIMLTFGIVGYLMRKFEYEGVPLVLGMVLGPMAETALRRSLIMSQGSFLIFVQRPVAAVLLGLAILILISPFFSKKRLAQEIIEQNED
jgi:putative tricarboxylic transport membrane protein